MADSGSASDILQGYFNSNVCACSNQNILPGSISVSSTSYKNMECHKLGTRLSMYKSTPHRTTLNYLSPPLWTAQTTWGIHSEYAHVLCRPELIVVVGPSKWALFCACLMWTAFCRFCCLGGKETYFMTLNKILLSSMHIGSVTHAPHAPTFAVISWLAPHQAAPFSAVWIYTC